MDAPYIGELRIFSGPVPQGWMPCDGTVLQISENQALFSLIGAEYGGDGRTTFALPDMRGRVGLGFGDAQGYPLAAHGGQAAVTIDYNQMPMHSHTAFASPAEGGLTDPANANWANSPGANIYAEAFSKTMAPTATSTVGTGQAHNNMQPYLSVTWAIAIQGIYPSRP